MKRIYIAALALSLIAVSFGLVATLSDQANGVDTGNGDGDLVTVSVANGVGGSIRIASSVFGDSFNFPSGAEDTISLTYGRTYTVTAYNSTGYDFNNWIFLPFNLTHGSTTTSTSSFVCDQQNIVIGCSWVELEAEYTVTVQSNNTSYGTVSNAGSYTYTGVNSVSKNGTTLVIGSRTFVATPKAATSAYTYYFDRWASTAGNATSISDAATYTAIFTAVATQYQFNVTASGHGSITGATSQTVPYGSTWAVDDQNRLVLTNGSNRYYYTAVPDTGYYFTGWNPSSGTVSANTTVTASFAQPTINLHTQTGGKAEVILDGATILTAASPQPFDNYVSVPAGSTITIKATATQAGYVFDSWYILPGLSTSTNAVEQVTVTQDLDISATFQNNDQIWTVTIQSANPEYGTVDLDSMQVYNGSAIHTSGASMTIGEYTVTATPTDSSQVYQYIFTRWTFTPGASQTINGLTINHDETIYANFERIPLSQEYSASWCNDSYNGTVDLMFRFDGSEDNKTHIINVPLYRPYMPEGADRTQWYDSGYSLTISVTYPILQLSADLDRRGAIIQSNAVTIGNWSTFVLSLDPSEGTVTATPVKVFRSFTDYTTYDKQTVTILDFSERSNVAGSAIYIINHADTEGGTNKARFSVVGTRTFLDTYGVVLYNPTINLSDYFPQYDSIRVNLYSFALYGQSMTINGTTYTLDGSRITVRYVSDGTDNYLPSVMPNDTPKSRTLELTNIYITFDGATNHVSLTFVNDRFTIDLGEYDDSMRSFSFQGIWYFTSVVYEPTTAVEKTLGGWKPLPTLSSVQMLLIFMAFLGVGAVAVAIHARKRGLGYVDLIIIVISGFVAFVLLEGF